MFGTILEELAATLDASVDSSVARTSLRRSFRRYLTSNPFAPEGGDKADVAVDTMLQEIDRVVGTQLDAILHHPSFQQLEAAWRGLKLVVDRTDFGENIKCEMLNCSKDDLLADFEDAPEIPKSGFYKLTYSAEYGPFGGRPYGAVIANYTFGPGPQDVMLLSQCATTCWMTAAPFIASAAPSFLGRRSLEEAANLPALEMTAQKTKWEEFRTAEPGRFAALVLGRFLVREPWALNGQRGVVYQESVSSPSDHLWANGGYALAVCISTSFAARRLASHMVGPISGLVAALPAWAGPDGSWQRPAAVEASFTPSRVADFVADGLIPLQPFPEASGVVFLHAPTTANRTVPSAMSSEDANQQLASVLFLGRIIHYVKVLQREQIGTWKERAVLEAELREFFEPYLFVDPAPGSLDFTARSLMDPLEGQLFLALTTHRGDIEHASVYADWLEERGRRAESEFLRLQSSYLRTSEEDPDRPAALAKLRGASRALDPGWHGAVSCTPAAIPWTQGLFRRVQLDVTDVPEIHGWYKITLEATLNCTMDGKAVTISLVNKLDKE